MPRRCAISGCNSKYMSSEPYISTFKFPECEETRQKWIAATNRTNWTPSKYSGICSYHFRSDDFTYHVFDEETKPRLRLKKGAVPTIFTTVAQTVVRIEEAPARSEPIVPPADLITDFICFSVEFRKKLDLTNYLLYESSEMIVFYKLQPSHDVGCNIATRICITNQMYVKVIVESTEIFSADLELLPRNMKVSRYSQIASVLDKYRHETPEFVETREHLLNRALHYLEKARDTNEDFDHFGKLDIIINQVDLLNKVRPRYEPESILMAFLIHYHSVEAYDVLKKFLMLPHPSLLKHVSSQIHTLDSSTPKNDDLSLTNTKATDKEKYVALVIDEILVKTDCAEVKTEDGCTAKIKSLDLIMVYTMKSIFGNFKKIIRILPVSLSTEETLFNLTKSVIQFVQRLGFKVLVVVTANTEINRKVFEKYCPTNNFFANPDFPELKIFYQYDSVRLFKSIRDNWIKLKSPTKIFTYPDIDDFSIKKAEFAFFELVFSLCKSQFRATLKKPNKLNATIVNPSISEQRNISLTENLFHDSTIEAMGQFSNMSETANFCGIIGKWWNIVNTKRAKTFINSNNWTVDENVLFLEKFLIWLDVWGSFPDSTARLEKQILEGLEHNTKTLLHLIKFSFDQLKVNTIALRKLRSDDYEGRFNLN